MMRAHAGESNKQILARAPGARATVVAPPHHLASVFLQMQRTHGNSYVQRALEAATTAAAPGELSAAMHTRIQRAVGGGRPLEDGVRATLEPAFGTDFSAVHVHTDAEADVLSRSLQARAFTLGQDIFFRQGDYNPESSSGRQLLAHELTHVLQQTGTIHTRLSIGAPDDGYEQEAERVAQQVTGAEQGQHAAPAPTADMTQPPTQRHILRRTPTPGAPASNTAPPTPDTQPAFDLKAWMGSGLHDLLKEHLGDDKLKGYSKSLAEKAASYATEQMKSLGPDTGTLGKIQLEQIGKLLAADLQRDVAEILRSPTAKNLRDAILRKIKMEPGLAIGMVLIALAMASAAVVNIPALQEALSDADLPEVKKEVNLGAGFTASGKADLSKLSALSFQHAELGLRYTSQYFQIAVTGAYQRSDNPAEQKAPDKTATSAATPPVTLKADAIIDENQRFKLNIAPLLDLKKFGVAGMASFDTTTGWTGFGEVRFGAKTNFIAPKVSVGADGQLTFGLTEGFTAGPATVKNTFTANPEQIGLGHSIAFNKPLGIKDLDLSANLQYRLDQPQITSTGFSVGYKILEQEADKANPKKPQPYVLINAQGSYTPPGKDQAGIPINVAVSLTGRF